MRSVPPPASGGLCRLKPAFQAGGATSTYTAEKRMHAMASETVTAQTQSIVAELRQLSEQVRELTVEVREIGKTLAAHDRKLDVLAAQMRLVIGAFGLLITALIAVFGILFTR